MADALPESDEHNVEYACSASEASCDSVGGSGGWSNEASGSSATSVSSNSGKHNRVHVSLSGITHLDSLDYMMVKDASSGVKDLDESRAWPEANKAAKGRHCANVARVLRESRLEKPSASSTVGAGAFKNLRLSNASLPQGLRLVSTPLSTRPLGCTKLVKRRQLELWRTFTQQVAPWLDACGSKRYFQHSLPLLAKNADYLHYAVLAISALFLEVQSDDQSGKESGELYSDAILLMSPHLSSPETPVVAASLLICVMDLMKTPAHGCRKSLEACATVLEMAEFNASSSGMQQSLFWCFANVSVWGGSILPQVPMPSMRQYYASDSLAAVTSYVRTQTWGEGYAKYAVFLTSTIIHVITHNQVGWDSGEGSTEYTRWRVLYDLIEDFHNARPEEFTPLMSYPSILDDCRHPFPMILYGSAAAVVGNLLYHSAAILLLQQKPASLELTKTQKSPLWHARQICGIVAENQEMGAWASVAQPLWVAGKLISHRDEQEKIVDMLKMAQRNSGWWTEWYVEDLRLAWTLI
jgi:hypothetical protein